GIFLNGKIDMIEKIDKTGRVIVYDFKTGKPKTRNYIEGKSSNTSGDYKRQLVFYKILLERFKEGKHKLKVENGVIEFVEADERGNYHSEAFEITQSNVSELEKLIREVAYEIKTLDFWDKTCEDKDCPYCKMRNYLKGQ
ncbi:MAG: PD-(D/E)XK nuclease family protein, partial [bacterium]|nr:PD-(D/E)XK nuclease family protein [bacterium]